MSEKNLQECDCSFTEIFALLFPKEILLTEWATTYFDGIRLKVIKNHIGNVIDILLQGLQSLGILISISLQKIIETGLGLDHIGYFISVVCNLIEALISLKSDIDFVIAKHGYK